MVAEYFCQSCSIVGGILLLPSSGPFTGTRYQHDKYIKHTAVTSIQGLNSVFTGPGSFSYAAAIDSALTFGFVERDDRSRINIVWPASRNIGSIIRHGILVHSADAVRVVLPNDPLKIRGFPVCSSFRATACRSCGIPF